MRKWLFGMLFVLFSITACNKNDFERNNFDDPNLKATTLDIVESNGSFAYGTYVFASNPKANPDGLKSLKLTNNRWGWANYFPKTFIPGNEFPNTLSNYYLNTNVNGTIVNIGTILVNYDEQNFIIKIIFNDGYGFTQHVSSIPMLRVKLSVPGSDWKTFDKMWNYLAPYYKNEFTYPLSQIPSPGFTIGNPLYFILEGYVNSNINLSMFLSPTIDGNNTGYQTINTIPTTLVSEKTIYNIDDGIWSIPNAFEIHNDGNFLYFNKIGTGFRSIALLVNGISVYDTYDGQISEALSCKLPLFKIPGFDGNGSTVNVIIEATNDGHGGAVYATGTYTFNLGAPPIIGNKVFPIYMGAALNNISKGTQIGIAYVEYDGSELKIKYDLFDEYLMIKIDIYAKDTAPTTTAPGQFGFTETFDLPVNEFETIINIEDIEGDGIWLILHASILL